MAGILANSATQTMVSGDTAADNAFTGFVTNERITLSASPSGTYYSWGLAVPSASAVDRSGLDSTTDATPKFIPDAAGYYVITCTVDGSTDYVLRIYVVESATVDPRQGLRFSPTHDAAIPAPAMGHTLYESYEQGGLVTKNSAGDLGAFGDNIKSGGLLDDDDQTILIADGARWTIPEITDDRTYTISTTGAGENEVIFIECRNQSAFTPTISFGSDTIEAEANVGYGLIFISTWFWVCQYRLESS